MTLSKPNPGPNLPRTSLPTMYDLPSEFPEEPGLPDVFHDLQPELLSATLRLQDYDTQNYFTGTDLNVYYDPDHPLWHKRPDWFLAVGVPYLYDNRDLRLSYVTWQEAANPFIIVELISPGTEDEDLGRVKAIAGNPPPKWRVYEQVLQVPYYIVFNRYTDEFQAFKLNSNRQYHPLPLPSSKLWIPELNLGLGLWSGTYKQIDRLWLRWYGPDGQWLLTDTELAQQQTELAQQQAASERQKAQKFAQKLRQLGIDPEAP
jgi:Uma2 family endonuclease